MGKILYCLVFVFLVATAVSAEEDQLEMAYKKQFEQYTAERRELSDAIKKDEEYTKKLATLYTSNCEPYKHYLRKECDSISKSIKEPAQSLKENKAKDVDIQHKIQELKIRILEQNNKLPAWWVE